MPANAGNHSATDDRQISRLRGNDNASSFDSHLKARRSQL